MVCPEAEWVGRVAARLFVEWAWQSVARKGRFCVALSGGSTPRAMYEQLAGETYRTQVDWGKVHVFWGDERCVAPEDPESNYGMARKELLLRVAIPPVHIHRMEAERDDLGRAAQQYEEVLREHLEVDARGFPRFDLILLGVGIDGHTASLFPGAEKLHETSRWVSTPIGPTAKRRMTLTLPVLNAARRVLFLVVGSEKAGILRVVLEENPEPPLPAQLVAPGEGERWFLLDSAAAALLSRRRVATDEGAQEPGGRQSIQGKGSDPGG
jgi:6-phosphogluconolactonase